MQGSKRFLVINELCVFRPKHISLFSASSLGIIDMAHYGAVVYGMEGDVCTSSRVFICSKDSASATPAHQRNLKSSNPNLYCLHFCLHNISYTQTDLLPDKRLAGLLPVQGSAQDRLVCLVQTQKLGLLNVTCLISNTRRLLGDQEQRLSYLSF